jgi:cytochrome b-561
MTDATSGKTGTSMQSTGAVTPPADANPGWFEERLGIKAFYEKFGRKAFPIHSTYFFGEMAGFCFIILVLTGIYLGIMYVPSNAEVTLDGVTVPEAYASVRLIESVPVANLFRNVHHWAAHLMIASVLLHMVRIFFTGTYRKPREINWIVGVLLLSLTLAAGFLGYSLPYDSYAVTATGVGYSIARSIPWVGETVSELIFGGNFPTLGSIPRLYTLHVFVIPALIAGVIIFHTLVVVKQKHTQPGYSKKVAEPGRVLGVPAWPYQAILAGQLLLVMFGSLFILSTIVEAHPLAQFGPPGVGTPAVKPDWYLLWVYGLLEIIPTSVSFKLFGASIEPNFIGGILFPGLIFTLIALVPFIDRTNRKAIRRFEYPEPPRQSALRMTIGMFVVALIGSLMLAAFYHDYDWSLGFVWALVIGIPLITAGITYYVSKATYADPYFDPTSEDAPAVSSPVMEIFLDDAYQSASYSDRLALTLSEAEALADHLDEAERDEAYAKVESIRRRLDIMSGSVETDSDQSG